MKSMIQREFKIIIGNQADWLNVFFFYFIGISVFAISLNNENTSNLAAEIIWLISLFAIVFSAEKIFQEDYNLGVFEQVISSKQSIVSFVWGKIVSHWLSICLPIVLCIPLSGIMLQSSIAELWFIMLTMLIASPTLSLLASLAGSLIVGLSNSGVMLTVLLLPLYIPVLMLALSAVNGYQQGVDYLGQLALLLSLSILSCMLAPLAILQSIKLSME